MGIRKVEDNKIAIPAFYNGNQFLKKESHENYLPKSNFEIDISPLVQSFTDEIQAFINGANNNMPKPELLYSLQLIAAKYLAFKDADCKNKLLQMIFSEVNNKSAGMVQLSDLKVLWNGFEKLMLRCCFVNYL